VKRFLHHREDRGVSFAMPKKIESVFFFRGIGVDGDGSMDTGKGMERRIIYL